MAVLLGLSAFALYAWIAPPVSGPGDGPELTLGLAHAGLVHPTGYPIYVLTGHFFGRFLGAFGVSWPLAGNLWSGAGAAVSVSICFLSARGIAREETALRGERDASSETIVALLPAALLALNPLVLAEAGKAEVNTWSLAWTLGAVALFLRWIRRVETDESPSAWSAAAWGLLCVAGLAHHATSVLLSLPLTVGLCIVLARRGHFRPRLALAAAAAAVVPLLSYALVAWRAAHPAPGQWPDITPTVPGVLGHITGERYRVFLGFFAPDAENRRALATAIYPFLFPGIVCLCVSAARAVSSVRRTAWWCLLASTLLVLLFTLQYGVPDPAPYLLPAVALALVALVPVTLWMWGHWGRRPLVRGLVLLALVAACVPAGINLRDARARRTAIMRFDARVHRLWETVPTTGAIVLWDSDQMARLVEYQVLRGENPGAWVTTPGLLADQAAEELQRRYGIDLLKGLEVPYAPPSAPWGEAVRREFYAKVIRRLNARTDVPLYWFDLRAGATLIPKSEP